MSGLFAVYKREVALIFRSPIAYAISFALLIFVGMVFATNIASIAQAQAAAAGGFAQPVNVTATQLMQSILSLFAFFVFLVAPLLTMRLLSEEAREGTLEVLMTLPMSEWAFVVGKFLAVWTFYTVVLLLTLVHLALLLPFGAGNGALLFSGYLGAWLYGGAGLALALVWSAVTEDQIVAAFLGAATVLIFFFMSDFASIASGQFAFIGEILRELGLTTHFQASLLQGIIRAEDVLYFALVIGVALFITTLLVGTRRWRA